MIASLKVGYKSSMLGRLLAIFDCEGGFERDEKAQERMRRGTKGLDQGAKANLLDAMYILDEVWSNDQKYCARESIVRCWRKANIMPPSFNAAVESDLGSSRGTKKNSPAEEQDVVDLVTAMRNIQVAAAEDLSNGKLPPVLEGSFAAESGIRPDQLKKIAEVWIDIEDDKVVMGSLLDEELEAFEAGKHPQDGYSGDEEHGEVNEQVHVANANPADYFSALDNLESVRRYAVDVGLHQVDLDRLLAVSRSIRQNKARDSRPRVQPTITNFFKPKVTEPALKPASAAAAVIDIDALPAATPQNCEPPSGFPSGDSSSESSGESSSKSSSESSTSEEDNGVSGSCGEASLETEGEQGEEIGNDSIWASCSELEKDKKDDADIMEDYEAWYEKFGR